MCSLSILRVAYCHRRILVLYGKRLRWAQQIWGSGYRFTNIKVMLRVAAIFTLCEKLWTLCLPKHMGKVTPASYGETLFP